MSKKEWFSEWFDSKYYHILYQHRDFSEAEFFIKNLTSYLTPADNSRILDLACGKGRHSVFLNKLGFNTVGVDLSPQSIEFANKGKNDRLKFYTHDMRKVETHGPYDYIFNLFTSFGYFEDDNEDLKVLQSVEQGLNDNGVFVLDFLNSKKVIANLVKEEVKILDGISFDITREFESDFVVKTIQFTAEGKEYKFLERVKALGLDRFKELFSQTNLEIQTVFGDYDLSEFDSVNSNRLVIVAKKVLS